MALMPLVARDIATHSVPKLLLNKSGSKERAIVVCSH